MARSTIKIAGCFEAAIGLTDAEAAAIGKLADSKGFKTTNTNDDYARAVAKVIADTQAQRSAIVEQLAKFDPEAAKEFAPVEAQPAAQDDDLDAMFDDIVAQESAKSEPKAPRAPRTTGQAAKSAVKNAASGIAGTIDALGALFSTKPGTLGSGPVFNADTYAAAKPLFAQAVADLKASGADIREVMQAVVRMVMAKFGGDAVAQMKPYIVQFTQDVRDGRIDIQQPVIENEAENDDTGAKESTNGPSINSEQGPQTLDGMATGEDSGAEGVGGIRGSDTGRGAGRKPNDSGANGPRVSGTRSGGSGSTSVRAPTPGEGRGRRGKSGTGSGLSEERSPVPVDLFSQPTEPVSVNNVQAVNFRITEDVRLGQGGEAEKFRDNLAAIRTLKAIEAEGRRATSEEQRTLARYVGWGGLANAFPNPESKEWKDEWKIRGAELQNLLTKKEYDLARRSTLDSHYTSHDIVSAMWAAAKRMGFKGGLAAETSMGVGNFLGLIPSELSGSTKFIGVEYDSLTARLAALLYPQSTILNSGIQDVPLADNAFDLNIGNPPFGDQSLRFQFKPEFNRVSIHNQFFLAGVDSLKPGGLQLNVVSRYLLDSTDKATRTMLAKKAKLVAAIRLPDTAFKENARTSVVTDIVILQRLTPSEEATMAAAFEAKNSKPEKMRDAEVQRQALAAQVPAWVDVGRMADPLGGEPMTVNSYFVQNPDMILGTLERSGKSQFKNDITVRPSEEALSASLAKAIAKLPEGIMSRSQEAVDASVDRFKGMSDALRISLSGQEAGSIAFSPDGVMEQVYERETPEGDYELAKRALTEASPWSESLYQDEKGNWYTIEAKLDAEGKPEKVQKNGKATNLNVYDRKMFASEADIPAGMLLGKEKLNRLTKLVKLRDLMVGQINLETEDAPSVKMEANRAALAGAYASFVAEEGFISKPANSSLVGNMPDGALVQALELSYRKAVSAAQARKMGEQPREEYAEPAPILSKRVIPKYEPPTRAESPADALSITLSESGRVDIDRMASLLGKTPEQITAEMFDNADKPLIFKDPETQAWVTRNDYLTGQVKKKLHAAQAANLPKHIAELEAIQPEPWGAENVTVLMGATFVPPQIYADFVQHVTGKPARVTFSQATNSFGVMADGTATREKQDEFGADGISIVSTVSALLNSTAIKVTESDGDGGTRINKELTDLALLKAKQIANEFTDWSFADSERRRTLVNLFNEKYNTRVNRQHDGQHLTLPGKVPDAILTMRRHQKNTIWRGISERFMLIDHVVGAGKTFTAIARAMERRRMGLSRKPAIIVPNHMVEQFTADVYRLYPGAKVLAAGKADFEKKKRRKVFAKIASGDWDIVIIPHSSFGKIGIAPETEMRYLEKELSIAEEAIKEAWEESDESEGSFRKPFNVKQAERLREKITTRMDTLKGRDNKDRLLTFEQMGIDDLTVDEAHSFKNLFYSSRLTGVKGMGNPSGSQKAFDLYSKVRVLRESPTGTVTFMTGTPISNSAVEMFNMMRYLAADELRELGLEHFDAWRSQFVSTDAGWEPNETGRLKEVNRLGRSWSNMRSLMDLYYSFTDSVGNEDIKKAYAEDNNGAQFPIPKVAGGDRKSVIVQPTKDQIELLEKTIDDFDSLPGITDPYERNIERLKLMGRARKVSLDVRAAVPGHKGDEKGGKLEKISDEVKRIYDKWTADRGTQLIFLDRSVPKTKGDDKIIKAYDALVAERLKALGANDEDGLRRASDKLEAFDADEIEQLRAAQNGGWNAYQQIKDNLVASGIPANEIRFIQEANNDAQKQALFDLVKSGEVRVLLGSTPRMGAGTNVQDRLIGLHHGDVTWVPSDIEQREGRIIRQGNKLLEKYGIKNFEVEILAYATERTIDAKMWSLNSSKLKTINAIRNYDGSFSMDFEDADSVSMAELAALASGNPLLLERVKLDSEINGLELLRKQHQRKMWGYTGRLDDAEKALKNGKPEAARYNALYQESLAGYEELQADKAARSVTIEGKEYKTYGEAAQAVKASITEQQGGDEGAKFSVKIGERRLTSTNGALDAISDALGDDDAFLGTLDGEKYIGRSAFARHIAKKANDIGRGFESGDTKMLATGTLSGFTFEASISTSIYSNGYIVDIALVDAAGKTVSTTNSRPYDEGKFTASSLVNQVSDMASAAKPQYFASQAKRSLERAERAEKELPELREKANTPFPQAEELKQKQARLEVVITELSADKAAPSNADSAQAEEDGQEDGSETRFSRSTGQVAVEGSLPVSRVTAIADAIKSTWKNAPEIVVASSMEDEAIPATVRDYSQKQMSLGASGDTQGFVHGGKVYLIASQLSSPGHVVEVLFHESLGHIGLKGAFGKGMEQVLNQVVLARNAEVRAKVKQYGLDVKSKSDMQHAAEEVLAEMAQAYPELGLVKRAIASIRTWLRENIPQLQSMKLTDAEIIRNFILPARRFVEQGGDAMDNITGQGGLFANENVAAYNAPYEQDLFGNPLPASAGKVERAKSERKGVPGDVQPAKGLQDTPIPRGDYFTNTILGKTSERELGAQRIVTAQQAAQATRYLYKSAVERFDGIVTDKNHRPLAVVGGFKGSLSYTSVYPSTLIGEAIRIPGAAHIWLSHNHPSGNTTLSRADENLNRTLSDVFRGSGIKPMGLLAVAGGKFSHVGPDGNIDASHVEIGESTGTSNVPVVERQISDSRPDVSIGSPDEAKSVGAAMYAKAKEPGIILTDAQHGVVAWVPITKEMMGPLRDTGALASIYRAVSQANAGGAFIIHGGELDQASISSQFIKVTPSENIAAALQKVDVRALDSINVKTNQSVAEQGREVAKGPMFARTLGPEAFSLKIAPRPTGMPLKDVQKAVAELSKTWKSGPTIKVVARTSDLPVRAPTDARGLIHKGTAYVVASNQFSRDDVARTLAHEAIGHYGLWEILGEEGRVRFKRNLQLALKSGNKPLKAISEQVRETYVDDNGDFNLNPAQEAYEIAAFAVEQALDADGNFNPGFGFVKQVWAKIADFLRELGIPIKFTNFELQGMLVASMRGLEAGQRLDGGGEAMVAASRGTKEAMTNPKDVVGNQGGRSADDTTPGVKPKHSPEQMAKWAAEKKARDKARMIESNASHEMEKRLARNADTSIRNADMWGHFTESEKSDIDFYRNAADKIDEGKKATINAIERALKTAGITVEHTSSSNDGKSKSLYVKLDNQVIRVSDHELPMTPSRENDRARGLTGKWDREVIVYDWQNSTMDEYLSEIGVPAAKRLGYARSESNIANGDTGNTTTNEPTAPDSGGAPVAQTETAAFKKWFGESVVTESGKAGGKPLVVYHGTGRGGFNTFDRNNWKTAYGHFFTPDKSAADYYTYGSEPQTYGVYLSVQNPLQLDQIANGEQSPPQWLEKWIDDSFDSENGDTLEQFQDWIGGGDLYNHNMGSLQNDLMATAENKGHDAVAFYDAKGGGGVALSWVVFDSTQVKSATGNRGTFDPADPDIRFSRASTLSATANKVVDKLNDHFNHEGTLNWWYKSLGSPYNLAQKSRPFKRVFTSAQDFLNDVSFYANEAADHAAKLLPKLESWKDIGKSPISAEDNKAIEAPIFEGTLSWARDEEGKPVKIEDLEAKYADLDDEAKGQMLMKNRVVTEAQLKRWKASQLDIYSGAIRNRFDATFMRPGVVWKDAELKSIFNLTPEQTALYRQFHAAVGTSLDNMAKAEMLRYGGKDVADMREMVLDAASADDAAVMLRDHLLELAEEDGGRSGILTDLANGMIDRADKVNKLKKEGYAPLSRFGQFSVDVVVDGERQYFGLFESEGESNKMAAQMREEFGAKNVETGTVAQAKFEQYKGITPESLELFGNMLGLDSTGDKESDKAFQEYLKLTKNNRSAMKRLIHRKGIAGYSTDTGRVLAAFIYSNARQTAAGLHMGEMADALEAIPKQEGQLSDYATKYADYVKNPQEEAQAIRGLMFAQYLGGNVASTFVNFTQPFTVSFPYLSQFGGVKGAAAALGKAMADQRKGEYEDDLAHALKVADEQGVTQPQSVHELQAQARGAATLRPGDGTRRGNAVAMASNKLSKLSFGWGRLFGMAEQINRRTTFIAAFRIAVEKGIANPAAFATKAVDETQFINNKGNRAKYSRGAIGSTVMTFKSYSINYMELLHRMATQNGPEGKQAVALAMVMLFLMAGIGGLPFAGDAEDLIDGIAQRMGYNFSTKKAKQEFLEHWLGKAGAGFVDRGLTGIPGAPIDVAGRMGMGNLIPGTGIFMPKADHTKDWLEFVGVGADLAKRVAQGGGQLLDGQFVDAALSVSPKAVSNLVQGLRMGDKGYYQDAKGAKVIDTTPTEAAFKAIGFQPQSVALVGESNWINQSAKNLYNLKAQSIRAQWAKGIFEGDQSQIDSARAAMQSWNEKNPGQRISPDMPAIVRKVKEMRKTKEQRIADTAPKAMKAQMRREITESNAE